ncbi:MAG: nuclear transport factor 2 family protein [Thalassotalea sp.]|nr:nuclear transport factor 2 family protein [Thalassotalea sp.]
MKILESTLLWIGLLLPSMMVTELNANEFNAKSFGQNYFNAWVASQSPHATKKDIEHYLSFLVDDIGHQHLPYDSDDARSSDGKNSMRKGMGYYLGGHTKYEGTLIDITTGHGVVVIRYDTDATGVHPQTKEVIVLKYRTLETLEIEDGKVSVIRKYSE